MTYQRAGFEYQGEEEIMLRHFDPHHVRRAQFPSKCVECGARINTGNLIVKHPGSVKWDHAKCVIEIRSRRISYRELLRRAGL